MKAESGTKPQLFQVDKVGEMAHISLFDNIREVAEEGEVVFKYDYYFLELPYRENLKTDIENNYDKWIELARNKENESEIQKLTEIDLLKLEMAESNAEMFEMMLMMFGGVM